MRLYEAKSGEALKDYSEVVAWLVPVRTLQTASLNADRPHYRIMQHDKCLSLICWWSRWEVSSNFRIAIPGFTMPSQYPAVSDSIFGPHRTGGQKTVRFDRSGVAYVFCNIHPQMAAVVLTVESPSLAYRIKQATSRSATCLLERTSSRFGTRMPRHEHSKRCTAPSCWETTTAACRRFPSSLGKRVHDC